MAINNRRGERREALNSIKPTGKYECVCICRVCAVQIGKQRMETEPSEHRFKAIIFGIIFLVFAFRGMNGRVQSNYPPPLCGIFSWKKTAFSPFMRVFAIISRLAQRGDSKSSTQQRKAKFVYFSPTNIPRLETQIPRTWTCMVENQPPSTPVRYKQDISFRKLSKSVRKWFTCAKWICPSPPLSSLDPLLLHRDPTRIRLPVAVSTCPPFPLLHLHLGTSVLVTQA